MANIATYFRGFLTELSNHPCGTALRKRTGYTTLTSSKFLLVWVVLGALESPCVQCQIYKVGVLGPWDCDPVFSMALPDLAAQLAVGRINNDLSLDLGQKVDFVILQEACNTSTALVRFLQSKNLVQAFVGPTNPGYCNAAALSGKDWDVAVFSWACADYELDRVLSYPTFTRTLPSPTQVLFTVLKYFGWASVGIVSSNDDLWTDNAGKLAISLRRLGLPVGIVASMGDNSTEMEQTLRKLQDPGKIKIIIMCMHSLLIGGELQAAFLLKASEMGMTSGGFVFIPYDTLLYSLPYTNTSYPQLQDNAGLRQAYDAVLTITVASDSMTFREAYDVAKNKGEINSSYDPQEVSPLFGTVYNSIYLLAKAMHNSRRAGQWLSGTNLASFAKNTTFAGFNQDVNTGTQGVGLTRYVVLDTDGQGSQLYSSHVVDLSKGTLIPTGSSNSFPGGSPPAADPSCWFEPNTICTKGVELTYVILVPVIIFVLGFSGVGVTLLFRRRSHQMQLVKGPNRILLTVEDLTFLDPQLSKKSIVMDAIEQKNGKNSGLSASMHSIMPSTTKASNIALLEGDWVWLKKFEKGQFKSVKRSTTKILTKMRDLRHENITLFLGFFMDGDYTFAVVTEHCSRGSLQDLLCSHDIKLDWMFKSSLLLDLIKGMKYLHHRELPHGHLNSRKCVVDGRFVLKITDYGFNELLESQNTSKNLPPAQDLLWTAPEHLRDWENTQKGTCKGDVYSFAIILQEVVVRGLPYCMVALSPEEIIRKVKKPPPMCRPTVTPDQAPMECIQLMKQSWAEQPDRRPSFNEIYNQFKTINKGKKTNIVDSMLRMLEDYSSNLEDLIQERTKELEVEKQRTEKLLSQMLPPSVAEALKTGTTVEPEYFDQVTIYFSDIVGFTTISALSEPIEVVDLLNDLYTLFDAVLSNHDVYKVETIGDAYMVASGLPKRNGNKHAAEIANMSLDILSAVGSFKMHHMPDIPVRIRIGLHSGSCVAGVVGLTMPRYCLFGDTVNTASRMESTGLPYRIHVNASTVNILQSLNEGYQVDVRGNTELKGKGTEETYWLVGKTGFLKPLPKPTEIKPGDNNHGLLPEEIAEYKRKKSERKA